MAVLDIRRISGETADYSKIIDSSASLQWLARVTSRQDTGKDVLQFGWGNAILPFPFIDFFPGSPILSCRHVKPEQDKSAPLKWIVTAEYSSEPLNQGDKDEVQEDDPTLRPARIKWSTNKYLKAVDRDINGKAIVNSVGDYFDPPVELDRSHWTVTVQKNLSWVPSWVTAFDNAINSRSFQIQGITFDALTCRIDELEISEPQEQNDIEFVVLTYKIEYRQEGYKVKVLDQGFRKFFGAVNPKIVKATSDDGSDVTSPVLLNGSGYQLSNPSPATAVYLSFDGYYQQDFNLLPLI